MIPDGHPLHELVLADSATEPDRWKSIRPYWIGASDAAKFSRPASIDTVYVPNKLTEITTGFGGTDFTRNGHAHEAGLTAWAGVSHNTKMFRHPTEPVFSATPDGLDVLPNGVIVLSEVKVKHRIVSGPTPAEYRQVAWAQYVLGASFTKWVWQALHPETHRPYGDPRMMLIDYNAELVEKILTIARPVRAAMLAARAFEGN